MIVVADQSKHVFSYREYYFITFDDRDDTMSKNRVAHIYYKLQYINVIHAHPSLQMILL